MKSIENMKNKLVEFWAKYSHYFKSLKSKSMKNYVIWAVCTTLLLCDILPLTFVIVGWIWNIVISMAVWAILRLFCAFAIFFLILIVDSVTEEIKESKNDDEI